jgi:hypothetical protein
MVGLKKGAKGGGGIPEGDEGRKRPTDVSNTELFPENVKPAVENT